jgi:hypothetical protein
LLDVAGLRMAALGPFFVKIESNRKYGAEIGTIKNFYS